MQYSPATSAGKSLLCLAEPRIFFFFFTQKRTGTENEDVTATGLAPLARSPTPIVSTKNSRLTGILRYKVSITRFIILITIGYRVEDSSPSAVVDRLARIESMLEQQSQQLNLLGNASSPRIASLRGQSDYFSGLPQQSDYLQSTTTIGATEVDSTQFLIPKDHATIASTLLALPRARRLLGDYPRDFFFQLEETLPLPGVLSNVHDATQIWPSLEPDVLDVLAMNYFQHVHPHQPLFTPQSFRLWQDRLVQAQVMDEITTAICFCVYALGTVCMHSEDTEASEGIGLEYFQPALRTILHHTIWGSRPNIAICQALLLAASYFSHLGRPLQSWKMAHFGSRIFLNLVER